MDTQNPQVDEIYRLLEENKPDQAKEALKAILNEEMSDQETGRVLVVTTMLYIKIMNDINEKYLEDMNERLRALEDLDKISDNNEKMFGLAKSRQAIKES